MDTLQGVFNIYCDESRVENVDSPKMVIGALIIPRADKDRLSAGIKALRNRYEFSYELKWTKTSVKFIDFYKEVLNYFVSEKAMYYRCIIVDKHYFF